MAIYVVGLLCCQKKYLAAVIIIITSKNKNEEKGTVPIFTLRKIFKNTKHNILQLPLMKNKLTENREISQTMILVRLNR